MVIFTGICEGLLILAKAGFWFSLGVLVLACGANTKR